MLVTIFEFGDRISILMTSFGCWCPTLMLKYRGCWWRKRPKPSPTSQSCRRHRCGLRSTILLEKISHLYHWFVMYCQYSIGFPLLIQAEIFSWLCFPLIRNELGIQNYKIATIILKGNIAVIMLFLRIMQSLFSMIRLVDLGWPSLNYI